MSERSDNDWIEGALQHESYIDDAGFSERVVAALPPRRRRDWTRWLIIGGVGGVGLLIAWRTVPLKALAIDGLTQLANARSLAEVPPVPAVLIVLCLWPLWGLLRTVVDWRSLWRTLLGHG